MKVDPFHASGTLNPNAPIYAVRAVYKGGDITLDANVLGGYQQTTGTVISMTENRNLPEGYIVIQSNYMNFVRGIALDVGEAVSRFSTGDSIRVNLIGATLARINGALVITEVDVEQISVIETGTEPLIRNVNVDQLVSSFEDYESTLVRVTADVDPIPEFGETLSGSKALKDAEGNTIYLYTQPEADFADETFAPSATFQGIIYAMGNQKQIRLNSIEGIMNPSGPVYSGYPEDFEFPVDVKTTYNMTAIDNNVDLRTGNWKLQQSLLGGLVGYDRFFGNQCVRIQQNLAVPAYIQMNYDLPHGATKVTFLYGMYGNDAGCQFQLEYSKDQGNTWDRIGDVITDAHPHNVSTEFKLATFIMDIHVPVRFRIHKLGLGAGTSTIPNGRMNIDNFTVFRNY